MDAGTPLTRDLVLVGGGHAHALVLRRWGMRPLAGARVTLINPGPTAPYTGMLPGHVAGHYGRDALDIDLVRLARFAGAAWIDGAVTGIDPVARTLAVPRRGPVAYDVASIDVGITADMPQIPGFAAHGIAAKPLGPFADRWHGFREAVARGERAPAVAVIGGGVAGVELAMAMAHALRDRAPTVTVIEAREALTGVAPVTRAALMRAMAGLGVRLRAGAVVERVEPDGVVLSDGTIEAALTVGAAGARPHGWLAQSGLPVEHGFVRVGADLGVEGHPGLFAAGDCAHLAHAPRPKAGVFAVRAAPVLHDNLRAALMDRPTRPFRPQRRYLKLISLGGQAALAERGGVGWSGGMLWRWKDRIDRAFMDKLTDLPPMEPPPPPKERAAGAVADAPLCSGCGAKVAAGALGTALAELPATARADVLSRPGDDAAVLDLGDGRRQVLTTDHLRAVVADPVLMTRIACLHALGDVWAMGAAPQAALASITLPRMSEPMQARTLRAILDAAAAALGEAGAELVGGHSTMGAEAVYGFTVAGLCDRAPIGHDGARPGDAVILTRPIGTGAMLAAEMAGVARGRDVAAMLATMARGQGGAAAVLADAHAMTDVTGFGLAGHLAAICRASGVGAALRLEAVPLYDGAAASAEAHRSTIWEANRDAAPVAGAEDARGVLLHDPQTAGGLLACVDAADAEGVVAALRDAGHRAAMIGAVEAGGGIRCV